MAPFTWSRWLRSFFRSPRVKTHRRLPSRRLHLEALEDRVVPSSTDTWVGLGGDANWKTAANWSAGIPTNGMDLVFSGNQQKTNNNNIPNLIVNSMTFDGDGFDLTGNGLTLVNTISLNPKNVSNTIDL